MNAGSYSTFTLPDRDRGPEDGAHELRTRTARQPASRHRNARRRRSSPHRSASTCPAGSLIGILAPRCGDGRRHNSRSRPSPAPFTTPSRLATSPGGLRIVTPVPAFGTTLVSSIPFEITPRGGGDYGLTGTLTDVAPLNVSPFGNLQVHALSFILNGATNNYVRNPTSCNTNNNTGQAAGYEDPTFTDGPAYQFGTTGCSTVPFKPTTTLELGDAGNTGFNRHAPFKLTITQAPGCSRHQGQQDHAPGRAEHQQPGLQAVHAGAGRCRPVSRQLEVRRRGGEEPVPRRGGEGSGLPDPADQHLPARAADRPARPSAREDPDQDHPGQQQGDPVAGPELAAAADLRVPHRPQRRQERRVPEPRRTCASGATRAPSSTTSAASSRTTATTARPRPRPS